MSDPTRPAEAGPLCNPTGRGHTGGAMSFRRVESGDAEPAQATDWIADATRRLAGLSAPDGEGPEVDPRWGADAIDRLRELGYAEWHAAMHEREIAEVIATRQSISGEVPPSRE
mgnify:CR=1 FL=1